MKIKSNLVPVKRVLQMIKECQNQNQIDSCKIVIENYVKSVKKHGISNIKDLQNRLDEELLTRQEQLYLVKIFNKNI